MKIQWGSSTTAGPTGPAGPAGTAPVPIVVRATNTSGQSIPDNAVSTVLTNWNEIVDTNNAFNPTTGIFTVPSTKQYVVTAECEFTAISSNVGAGFSIGVYVDGSAVFVNRLYVQVASSNVARNPQVTTPPMALTAGQLVAIRAFQDSGSGSNTLSTVAFRNYLGIWSID